jgi:hypothetical protein
VTCEETRELFSARLDGALAPEARAALDGHLAACAECAREWERFATTVELLRAVAPARAPAGFVDRVLAARPRPWYRRLVRGAFTPWPVKLPLEAAAIVLVAGLAILIVQRSPQLPPSAPEVRAPGPAEPAPLGRRADERVTRDGATSAAPAVEPPAAPAPEPARREASRAAAPPLARLAVADPAAAERSVVELVTGAGGRVIGRSEEPGAVVLDVLVPGEGWGPLQRELQTLGPLRIEGPPGLEEGLLRVTLRLER